jgi:N-acetylneuraminic acid mutarotase
MTKKWLTHRKVRAASLVIGMLCSLVITASAAAVGEIGIWNTTSSIPTAVIQATTVTYNGYIYELGGDGNSGTVTNVSYAPLNPNGTIGTWTATTPLTDAVYGAMSVAYNGYIYEMGGFDHTGDIGNTYYAPLNPNGTIGTWTATTAIPNASFEGSTVESNGYIYVLGGEDNGGTLNTTYFAPLNPNGTIGTWTSSTVLPTSLWLP